MSKPRISHSADYLIRASDTLALRPDFKLVGRSAELQRLSAILMRNSANSVLLVGAGGVGCTAICLGLQAMKADPTAPFDIVNKRLYWLDTDGLFASGDPVQINEGFQKALRSLSRSPETILLIEDTKNFVEAARNSGSTHLINALMREIRNKKFQAIFESRDDDLEIVLKCHSDMREIFTLLDIQEPAPDDLLLIIKSSAEHLQQHHGIKISEEAIKSAILQTSKYRVSDLGLSRAQPERSLTLLDRALTTYRQKAHAKSPELAAVEKQLTKLNSAIKTGKADKEYAKLSPTELQKLATETEEKIHDIKNNWEKLQQEIRKLSQDQRTGEQSIRELEEAIIEQQLKEQENREQLKANKSAAVEHPGSFSVINAGFDSSEIREIKLEIQRFQSEVDENKAKFDQVSSKINSGLILTAEHVLLEFSHISGIPVSKLTQDERVKLLGLKDNLASRVFGQDQAVEKLSNAVCVARAGLQDPNKPQASFLFLGPSGVGKTEIAKALTVALMDDERALLRFDMSEYMEKHAVAKLIGAPPGYEGYEAGGILTNALRKNPNRIILFDEIEKAHPDIFNVFLQILDDARLTDNRGLTVSFHETVIIMTTNIGTLHFLNEDLTPEDAEANAMKDLANQYRPEFLNRFNGRRNIVCFSKLALPVIEKIAQRELAKLNSMIHFKSPELFVEMPTSDLLAMCQATYEPVNGARGVTGYIADIIKPTIADTMLRTPEATGVMALRFNQQTQKVEIDPPKSKTSLPNSLASATIV